MNALTELTCYGLDWTAPHPPRQAEGEFPGPAHPIHGPRGGSRHAHTNTTSSSQL